MNVIIRILLLLSLLLTSVFSFAQDSKMKEDKENVDILYMKDGKKIKGIILKHELGVVSIMLTDSISKEENVLRYQQNDILKIEKRQNSEVVKQKNDTVKQRVEGDMQGEIKKSANKNNGNIPVSSDTPVNMLPDKNQQAKVFVPTSLISQKLIEAPVMMPITSNIPGNQMADEEVDLVELHNAPKSLKKYKGWFRQIRGFRFFIDYAYISGIGKAKNNKMEFATSLGYQFNPIFYAGVGTAYHLSLNKKDNSLPVFLNGRINFIDDYTTPFLDVRTGYSVAEGRGFYFSSAAGVSFTRKGKQALNLAITYTSQNVKYYEWKNREQITIREAQYGVGLKISYEL